MSITTEQMLVQHQKHTKTLSNGDHVIGLPGGVYDLFSGEGWDTPIRFRIVRFKDKTRPHQLIQITPGTTLSSEYRNELLKEFP